MTPILISLDIKADFGFFKKPEINDGVFFSFNSIHKPALIGMLGSLVGLGGFSEAYKENPAQLPEYYLAFKKLDLSFLPLQTNTSVVTKQFITYTNTTGFANRDGNLIIKEQTLIKPQFRVYLKLELSDQIQHILYDSIKNREAVYIPYMGKNEFPLYWNNVQEYPDAVFDANPEKEYTVLSFFMKPDNALVKNSNAQTGFGFMNLSGADMSSNKVYFERLPTGYNEETKNYSLAEYIYTKMKFMPAFNPGNLVKLFPDKDEFVQLF